MEPADQGGWSRIVPFREVAWDDVPDVPGVNVILDGDELLYVGMAGRDGKGSLRRRLRNHYTGNMMNMFKQYLWFAIVQHQQPALVSSPSEAARLCRAYV